MTGISETMFDLSSHVNRAMVVTTLWAMEGKPEPKGTNRFSDVPAGRYFTKAVQWAAENEIVTGHVGGTYKPFDAVSRQQLVTIMYQYARLHEWDSQASGSLAPYVDQADISGYGVLPFRWAVGHGLISGDAVGTCHYSHAVPPEYPNLRDHTDSEKDGFMPSFFALGIVARRVTRV